MKGFYLGLLLVVVSLAVEVSAGVVTCAGIVQASSNLAQAFSQKVDYSPVQVHLYTKEGLLKYSSECTPNGNYLIPVYDKGQFYLQVEGPAGWAFEPANAPVTITDAQNDCSDDVNFIFSGFSLSGEVKGASASDCAAAASGPEQVIVSLYQASQVLATTETNEAGKYTFNNIYPGEYTVRTTSDVLAISPETVSVKVELGNGVVKQPFMVSGYSLTGLVGTVQEPVPNIDIFLYSVSGQKQLQQQIPVEAPILSGQNQLSGTPLMYSKTDDKGEFLFQGLPCGQYKLVPSYKRQHTTFVVSPEVLDVQVDHANTDIGPVFEVLGFSVTGTVVDGNGKGVAGATVQVSGGASTQTDSNGVYLLDGMTSGTYTISAEKEHYEFQTIDKVAVSASATTLPALVPSKYAVCGSVNSGEAVARRDVVLEDSNGYEKARTSTDNDGKYCFMVAAGAYVIRPVLTASESSKGLLLSPPHRSVNVVDAPVLNAGFTEARVSLSGHVKCIRTPCDDTVTVAISSPAGSAVRGTDTVLRVYPSREDGSYEFTDIFPGSYEVRVEQGSWCWDEKAKQVVVEYLDVKDVNFVQSGFMLHSTISHPITVIITRKGDKEQVPLKEFDLQKGTNRFCLAEPGIYTLQPISCCRFEEEVFTYDTEDPRLMDWSATGFTVTGYFAVDAATNTNGPISVRLTNVGDASKNTETVAEWEKNVPEEVRQKIVAGNTASQTQNLKIFKYAFTSAPSQTYEVEPGSLGSILFYPKQVRVSVPASECPDVAPTFYGREAMYRDGSVVPAVEGVTVSVRKAGSDLEVASVSTDASGVFHAGPLYDDEEYDFVVSHPDYHFVRDTSADASVLRFSTSRLAKVQVRVVDKETQEGIPDVLVALTGSQFRGNDFTNENGEFVFSRLLPDTYFVQIMMKEFAFTPKTQSFTIEADDSTHTIEKVFYGDRVAYSVFGSLSTLNGEGEGQAVVQARELQQGGQTQLVEETKSGSDGTYRLRGLQPGSSYVISVKPNQGAGADPTAADRVDHASPASRTVQVQNQHVRNVDFTVFRSLNKFDITGTVSVDHASHADTLTVRLVRQSDPETVLKQVTLAQNMRFFEFFSIPKDDYRIQVSSTLSTSSFSYTAPAEDISLSAHTHVPLHFSADYKVHVAEVGESSLLTLIFAVALASMVLYRNTLRQFFESNQKNENGGSLSRSSSTQSVTSHKARKTKA